MKLRMILDVEYIPNTTGENTLREHLNSIVTHAMGAGLVTGDTDAEVVIWDTRIHKVDESHD